VFARAGHDVVLYDTNPDIIDRFSMPLIQETLKLLDASAPSSKSIELTLRKITVEPSLEKAVSDAFYIQESIREDLDDKIALFKDLAELTDDTTILASSTSAIMGSKFLLDIRRPERALIAHPVNPPSLIPLVELCGTTATSQDILNKAERFLTKAGMKPITLRKEIDGFILNRLQYTFVAEAMHLVGEGYCSAAAIDRVMTEGLALRWASIGPFEVAHLNSTEGFRGFVDQLGPMMRHMGRSAKTDYPWPDSLATNIHEELCVTTPVSDIPKRQQWRNSQILATRTMQASGKLD
jgi:3-hydroxyacyl-CoA dehydrogenase